MYNSTRRIFSLLSESTKKCHALNRQIRKSSSISGNAPKLENVAEIARDNSIPRGTMGQPTSHTHPHLVKPGELVSGLTTNEFLMRRAEFMRRIVVASKSKNTGHTVLIPSASKLYMSDMIPFIFRQNSDFFYLTGCLEPDSVLMMTSLPGQETIHKTVLFLRGRDAHSELWDGPRTSLEDAIHLFKVDATLPYMDIVLHLERHLVEHRSDFLWYSHGSPIHVECNSLIKKVISCTKTHVARCPRTILASQRLIKSPAEAALMQQACEVGSKAMNNAMAGTKPGLSEHDIHASIDYWCRRSGAIHLAFPPVVGGGARATSIHYIHDNQTLSDQELLLVDAGCQHSAYNSDITRTWPVSGKFTNAQAVLYDIVFAVQASLLEMLRRDRPTLDKLFDQMCFTLGKYLKDEGIFGKNKSTHECAAAAFKFCPHHVSHYLGLDVHDTPQIKRDIPVQTGMVITVEPGIYIPANEDSVPEEFRGIGIRIEDDVLITHGDPVILTKSCIKNRKEIQEIVGTKSLPQ